MRRAPAQVTGPPGSAMSDNDALHRFVTAVEAIAPNATGAPVSIDASSRTIVGAFVTAGIFAFVSITLLLAITLRRALKTTARCLALVVVRSALKR